MNNNAITAIRVLVADMVQKANSGHPGMAIGSAPAVYTVWKNMRHNPKDPFWTGRDRFVLSAGHMSALEYAMLYFYGYGLKMDDIKSFRQWGSLTPGHPEYGHTVGVEATAGPLGQGFAMAVGMAMAEAHMAAKFNREGFNIVDNYTYTVMGDGCMMEGAASEAASLAGCLGLSKLIALYDSNRITIEGSTDLAFTEDVGARFKAYGWQVIDVEDGEDCAALQAAIDEAKREKTKPSLIIYKTEIAHGTPLAGKSKSHGEPLGEDNIKAMKEFYGWKYDESFYIPDDVYAHFDELTKGLAADETEWNDMFAKYAAAYPELAEAWKKDHDGVDTEELLNDEELWSFEGKAASRATSGETLNRLAERIDCLFGGSADLGPSNKTVLKGKGDFAPGSYEGKNIHFGIRELAMACICNGISLYGGLRTYCATFFVFADYVKPALRLSALMKQPVMYILTHDSIGVGEDGPTHEPIEQLAMLRATPDCITFRPADGKEVTAAYITALGAKKPTVIALSRQNLPLYETTGKGALKGGYVLKDEEKPDVILMASGSEVECLFKADELLKQEGIKARIVSMPSFELFDEQSEDYKKSVLPDGIRARVAVEAGSSFGWQKYTGLDGEIVALDRFGASAPGGILFKEFGLTGENVAAAAKRAIAK